MRNINQFQEKENFYSSRSLYNFFKPQINKIFDIKLREPPILKNKSKSKTKVFQMSDQDKKKIEYLIQIGLSDNTDEIQNPYFNFIYNVEIPDQIIRKWRIRRICFEKDKFLIDVFQGQYMKEYGQKNANFERFLYPQVIGTQK
ncbi:unnamed protein product [Paramecium sonneborni]|uniref:Uncharacterized protein n=1 Tax=Paramecium sonneborni TaxID=65129 RepID=A0A8S1L2H4_9CILI|nr:unnamed protein product [Paramecium sonneborni]